MIINDDSSIVNKLETLLIDDARSHHLRLSHVYSTGHRTKVLKHFFSSSLWTTENKLVRLATKQASSAQSIVN